MVAGYCKMIYMKRCGLAVNGLEGFLNAKISIFCFLFQTSTAAPGSRMVLYTEVTTNMGLMGQWVVSIWVYRRSPCSSSKPI